MVNDNSVHVLHYIEAIVQASVVDQSWRIMVSNVECLLTVCTEIASHHGHHGFLTAYVKTARTTRYFESVDFDFLNV